MAGRGRGATLPAWMTSSRREEISVPPVEETSVEPAPCVPGQFDDPPVNHGESNIIKPLNDDSCETKEKSRSRKRSKSREKDRDRHAKSSRSHRSSRRRSSSRSKDRTRDRSSRRDRDKDRDRRKSSRRSRSKSRSHDRSRRKKRKSNFDVRPPGVTDENAKEVAAQAILQQSLAALGGSVGAASFGGISNMGCGANMQQTRHARRLYVGGIGDTNEQQISDFFNEVIDTALGSKQEGGAVVSVYINHERHFAFVELNSIELTSACMQLDGISYRGNPLKIRRPNDYNPVLIPSGVEPSPELNLAALGIVGTTVPDGPNKIFVGGIPYHLGEDQVKELLQAFGTLKAFHLVKEPGSSTSKGYGFCEYLDPRVTTKACEGLNTLTLGDKTLTVRRAMSQNEAKLVASATGSMLPGVFNGMDAVPQDVLSTMPPTRVLVLLNMVISDELQDDEEFEDIFDDVKDECSKLGNVMSVTIPRPGSGHPAAIGKVFVEFESSSQAQTAATSLNGRIFGTRIVRGEYYDEQKYALKELE